jgi:hypothetical protein
MAERTPKALADALEPTRNKRHAEKRGRFALSLGCQTEDEAVLVAHELGKRGWKAAPTTAVALINGDVKEELQLVNVVRVTGRKKGAS